MSMAQISTSATLLTPTFPYSLTSGKVQQKVSLIIFHTVQVVMGYVVNAERNIFHKKICNTNTVGSKCLKTLKKSGIKIIFNNQDKEIFFGPSKSRTCLASNHILTQM